MSNNLRVLFFGDIVGRIGRNALSAYLSGKLNDYLPFEERFFEGKDTQSAENNQPEAAKTAVKELSCPPFIIANVENASHGFGLTVKNHEEILNMGVNCMTSGNHIWDKKDIFQFINDSPALIRPYNYHHSAQGKGYRLFLGDKLLVVNLLGKTFMNPIDCPFQAIEKLASEVDFSNKIVLVDYHAEATAEKISFAKYASNLGVTAVIGTHTHVQTADEKIINEGKCAYITDAGFTGAYDGVIGMDYDSSIRRLITSIPERFDVADSLITQVNAVDILFDLENNLPVEIKRINFTYEEGKEGEREG